MHGADLECTYSIPVPLSIRNIFFVEGILDTSHIPESGQMNGFLTPIPAQNATAVKENDCIFPWYSTTAVHD